MIDVFISCVPPSSTHQAGLRIIKPKDRKPFIGKYKTSKAKLEENSMLILFREHRPEKPFDCPIALDITYVYPWRSAETKKNKALGIIPKDTIPDCDNLAKGLTDVLTTALFWTKDSKISDLRFRKFWGDEPGIRLVVYPLEAAQSQPPVRSQEKQQSDQRPPQQDQRQGSSRRRRRASSTQSVAPAAPVDQKTRSALETAGSQASSSPVGSSCPTVSTPSVPSQDDLFRQ